ncbi:flagellar basal body-associated protein FliL [Azospirillum fermentarium]|uniref:hypothetical protein n=1 Tax=Azospirillum fermentarium TaxID=1233114 RepID=UPI00222698AF|nr:hypothetical protein [Azospirillum fermentarium]MCW2246117.1 flagellar basal body-associated protein FliL [Azospirillum fermentarium]
MKIVILLIVGLLLLAGAAAGGLWLYHQYTVPKEENAAPKPPPPPPPPGPPAYIRVSPIVVPMIGANRVQQFITIVATVEIEAAKQPQTIGRQTQLIDAFITALYAAVDDRSIMMGNIVNIPAVKTKLTEAAAKVLGKDVVHDVLVQVVTQRNL